MKQCLSLALVACLLLSLLAGLPPVLPVSAETVEEAAANATFTYDLTAGMPKGAANERNQLAIADAEGYVTFTAEGTDPYFRFADGFEPTPAVSKLAYMVIEYRTTATIAKGEFFTNRRSGAHWGDNGTYVTCTYLPDGAWHTTVADASDVWGKGGDDQLYAFRFDPLASGANPGDTIDIAAIRFFETAAHAEGYAARRETAMRDEEATALKNASQLMDLSGGVLPVDVTVAPGVEYHVLPALTRVTSTGTAVLSSTDLARTSVFETAKLAIRTAEAGVPTATVTLTAHYGEWRATAVATVQGDGHWQELTIPFALPDGLSEAVANGTTLDTLTLELSTGTFDIAYIGAFSSPTFADAYRHAKSFDTHAYVMGETALVRYNTLDTALKNPFCAPGESFGQKFETTEPVCGVFIPGHATWGADPQANEGYFKLFSWQGDYAKTVASAPLYEEKLQNLRDGEDLTVTFETLPAGAYCFEVKMTTPGDKAYTGFSPANTAVTEGTVSFRNGRVHDNPLVAGYMTVGEGLVDVGNEYGMEETFGYDFTRRYDSATEAFGINSTSGVSLTELCDQGYLTITNTGNDPFFAFGESPVVPSNLMDHVVIKYRTATTAQSGELFVDRSDGVTWGQPYEKSNLLWNWVADGEWQVAVIDATASWGNVYGVTLQNIRFDPLEKPTEAGETIDVCYIKFFANAKAAHAFAATEYVTDGETTTVRPPARPIDPATVKPAFLLEGEALSVSGGIQMKDTVYDFDQGFVTLTATGADPGYYLIRESKKVAPYMAIRYRTTLKGAEGEVYVGSQGSDATGTGDHVTYSYKPDGAWHTAIVDLSVADAYPAETDTVTYLRFDFLTMKAGSVSGGFVEVAYIGFFDDPDAAAVFVHTPPRQKAEYTATFLVNGHKVHELIFKEGDTAIEEPVVPHIPGMIGAWEPYTLKNASITINAVYTPAEESAVPDMPPITQPPADTEVNPPAPGDTAEPIDTTATPAPESETAAAPKEGCASAISLTVPALLLLAALAVSAGKHRGQRSADRSSESM